jgi:hypothetical protein
MPRIGNKMNAWVRSEFPSSVKLTVKGTLPRAPAMRSTVPATAEAMPKPTSTKLGGGNSEAPRKRHPRKLMKEEEGAIAPERLLGDLEDHRCREKSEEPAEFKAGEMRGRCEARAGGAEEPEDEGREESLDHQAGVHDAGVELMDAGEIEGPEGDARHRDQEAEGEEDSKGLLAALREVSTSRNAGHGMAFHTLCFTRIPGGTP